VKKFLLIILAFLSIVALAIRFGAEPLMDYIGSNQRAGLRIEANKKSQVLINGELVGETPFQNENLKTGEYLITLTPPEATSEAEASVSAHLWKGYVHLNNGTLSVINRELESQAVLSSGEIITLKKGSGVNVVSTPGEAMVSVDGKDYGRTPVTIQSLTPGEHQFVLSRENYLKRSIRVTLVEDYALTLAVDLAISEADLSKSATIPTTTSSDVVVKQTPTGFLRMREDSTVNAKEVTRIAPGEKLTLIEEKTGWSKVRTKEGKEGWVSSAYIQKN
jgi:hypothetical protein